MVPSNECSGWFGVKFPDLDCEAWLPYMDAATVSMDPQRKFTIPMPTRSVAPPVMPVDMTCVYNECASDAEITFKAASLLGEVA